MGVLAAEPALGSIIAGSIANRVVYHAASPFNSTPYAGGLAVFVLVLFAGPLLAFTLQLPDAKRRGMFQYGALAGSVGAAFEHKWLKRAGSADEKAVEVEDLSATTDLFQVVANVYEMKIAPLSATAGTDALGAAAVGAGGTKGVGLARVPGAHGGDVQVHNADAPSEPDCPRDQEQPCPDDDGPDGSRDALTGRCET